MRGFTKREAPVKPRPKTHPRTQLCQTGAGQKCCTLPAPCYSVPISTIGVTRQLSVTIVLGTCTSASNRTTGGVSRVKRLPTAYTLSTPGPKRRLFVEAQTQAVVNPHFATRANYLLATTPCSTPTR